MLRKIGAVGGAVAIVLCWPFATGQIGERIYLDTVGKYENPYLTISSESYDRGYLNSDAVSRIEIKDDWKPVFDEEGLPDVWYVQHKVSHGFMGVTSTSELVLDEELRPIADKLWGEGVSPISFTTNTALTRKTDFNITMKPVSFNNEQGAKADIKAFVLEGTVDAQGAGEFRYQLPDATVTTAAQESMVMTGLEGGGKGRLDGQFWIGSQDFALKHVSFKDLVNNKSVEIDNVALGMNNVLGQADPASEQSEQQLTNTNMMTIEKIVSLDGQEYRNFNFKLAFSDLNYPAISRLGNMADDIDEQMSEQQAKEAALALDLLVAKGLKFTIEDLSLVTPKGDVKSHLNLVIAPGIARASENMAKISEKLTGDISLLLPIQLVDEDPILFEKASMMEQSGIVEKGADYYSLQMQIEGDKIILASGDQLPLAMLLMLFM
ncbi:hypothetical protein BIT28_13110 [Photobacterium proteolyticum]|uniref:DUF945 domain-containing protein n=1 Tax=Photobacterium proteolyticum TaxID=1903952 RepID=A0A1Q9GK93_9GAMM|nr:DUF945 family protein [Photobacterium proteolyticum]OLQ74893.1 hypothetical protein BIT28_13110 [Photobacterium proteolyticum]